MTCGNPFKHKIQKVIVNFLDMFSVEEKITDEKMECMQFGICHYTPKKLEEIPYFHFQIFKLTPNLAGQVRLNNLSIKNINKR